MSWFAVRQNVKVSGSDNQNDQQLLAVTPSFMLLWRSEKTVASVSNVYENVLFSKAKHRPLTPLKSERCVTNIYLNKGILLHTFCMLFIGYVETAAIANMPRISQILLISWTVMSCHLKIMHFVTEMFSLLVLAFILNAIIHTTFRPFKHIAGSLKENVKYINIWSQWDRNTWLTIITMIRYINTEMQFVGKGLQGLNNTSHNYTF